MHRDLAARESERAGLITGVSPIDGETEKTPVHTTEYHSSPVPVPSTESELMVEDN